MKWTKNHNRSGAPIECSWRQRLAYAAALGVAAVLAGTVHTGAQQAPQSGQQPASASATTHDPGPGLASTQSPPQVSSAQSGTQNLDAASTERKKQIVDESARLLKLAKDLKAEVDKTTKDTLSLNVIRKADQIEKLAHNVKEQMKVAEGSN
ncbi:MAG: hypothetical protein ABR987_09245 [Terracidiphilus sp.]